MDDNLLLLQAVKDLTKIVAAGFLFLSGFTLSAASYYFEVKLGTRKSLNVVLQAFGVILMTFAFFRLFKYLVF